MGLLGSRSSESSPIVLVLGTLRKGANQLALEPLRDAEAASGNAERDRRLSQQPVLADAHGGMKTRMEEALLSSHLSVALLRLLLAESNRKPLAWDSRKERSLQRSQPQHHRAENRRVDLEQKGNMWQSGTQLLVVL